MNFKIHRGTKEIGGSCVEIWTDKTRILIDFGMPLVEKNGKEFNFDNYKNLSVKELIDKGVLHKIKGLYKDEKPMIDGVVLSHPHQDHYGFMNYINSEITFHLGEATHSVIKLSNMFTPQNIQLEKTKYFEKSKPFTIGDFSITPFWMDHSAFDSYAFLIEANGKSLFYSGDFRSHGRKRKVFYRFIHNAPQNVDYLLLEGTTIGRNKKPFKTEEQIENELIKIFKQPNKINLIYTSGQNIDRLVSIYKACNKTNKIMVVDIYVAEVLEKLSKYAGIQHPSNSFKNLKVIYPKYLSDKLNKEGNIKILHEFVNSKITKKQISEQSENIVMLVRPSMKFDLMHIDNIDGGNLIYSMWLGYKKKYNTKRFLDYLESRNFTIYDIHTSGHADVETLKKFANAIKPKNIVPIHTFKADIYKDIFDYPVVELDDGESN
ncbi:MAG: MBL fold metallo-hydrolase [Candidatus Marinimicrobia bacterium]|jgi:ribonuclease J|nr:MBL fold metallo-hydrolase [Candidatus Neomarinimicrobiota bacterium]